MSRSEYKHATCVIWKGTGILFVGDAGSGKSSFAAELISRGGELVSDDQVMVCEENGKLYADAAPKLAGVLELRDIGLVKVPYVASTQIHLVVECAKEKPQVKQYETFNITLPCIVLDPAYPGNAAKLILYAQALQEGRVLPADWKPGA